MSSGSTTPQPSGAKPFARQRRRRWARVLAIFALLAVIAVFSAPYLIPWIISIKLKAEIADRLNGRLELGRVTCIWPYGVRVENMRLTGINAGTGETALFEIGRIELTLAKLPIGEGPLLVERIDIQDPVVHFVRTMEGVEGANLVKNNEGGSGTSKKLSDIFELRSLSLRGGEVAYEDRTRRGGAEPVVWKNLQVDLQTTPTSRSGYQFQFTAKDAPTASIEAAGDMDIDTMLLNVSRFSIVVHKDSDNPGEELPAQVQEFCRRFGVKGEVSVSATARIPLRDANQSVYAAQIQLRKGSCKLPDWEAPISSAEVSLSCSNSTVGAISALPTTLPDRAPDIQLLLSDLKITSGNQTIQAGGDGQIDLNDNTWSVGNVAGLADLGDGPGPIGKAGVRTHLPLTIGGAGEFGSGSYILRLGIADASALFMSKKLPLNQVAAHATFTPGDMKITQFTGTSFDGGVSLIGNMSWSNPATGPDYGGRISVTNMDMRQLANVLLSDEDARQRASGVGDLHLHFKGKLPPDTPALDAFTAKGDFDIRHGHFADIPVLKGVMAKVKDANAATVGEAAATFSIANRQVEFQQAVASAPAVGVQGRGTLGFDGAVNMNFIITPLADWREKLADTDVPILNTFGAMIAGKAQAAVNSAERAALYQYRVTGMIYDPKTEQIAAPAVTDAIQSLFKKMSGTTQEDAMSQELRRRQEEEEKNAER
jgi:hypothetical protein